MYLLLTYAYWLAWADGQFTDHNPTKVSKLQKEFYAARCTVPDGIPSIFVDSK